jgi:hypothetical protein
LSQNEINGADYQFQIPLIEKNIDLFFRLKMIDFDGSYEYSPAVRVSQFEKIENNFSIYPNPTNALLNVVTDQTISKLEVIDMLGSLVLEQYGDANILSLQGLESGVYLLRIIDELNQVSERRVVKY